MRSDNEDSLARLVPGQRVIALQRYLLIFCLQFYQMPAILRNMLSEKEAGHATVSTM